MRDRSVESSSLHSLKIFPGPSFVNFEFYVCFKVGECRERGVLSLSRGFLRS